MKLLTTLILMTLSTFAFADVSVNDTNKTDFIYVSKKVHDQLEAQYNGMIYSVNSNLYSKPLDEESVRFESTQVIYNNVKCKSREGLEEIEWCELKRNELVKKLTNDVMKSDLYQMSVRLDTRKSILKPEFKFASLYNFIHILAAITIICIYIAFEPRFKRWQKWGEIDSLPLAKMMIPDVLGFLTATGVMLYYYNTILSNLDKITSMGSFFRVIYGNPFTGSISLILTFGLVYLIFNNKISK